MSYNLRMLASFAALSLLVAGCAGGAEDDGAAANTDSSAPCAGMEVQVAQANPGYPRLPVYVANYGGLFAETGLEVKVAEANSGADATAALVGGSADINAGTFGDILLARAQGAPIVAFAASGNQEISNLVVKESVLQEKGITADSSPEEKIRALQGLNIGVTSPGSSTDLLIRAILLQNGMNPDEDVNIVPVGASAMGAAFSRGDIEAFALSSPSANAAAEAGDGEVLINFSVGEYPGVADTLFMTMNTSEEAVESKREELACFADGIAAALELMKSDPEAAKEFAWEEFDGVVDREAFDATIDDNISAFAENTDITEEDARKRQEIIGSVVPEVLELDITETFVDVG